MARYQVQGPDGAMHIIEGPDNAAPADIEAFAASSIPALSAAPSTYGDRLKTQTAAIGRELQNLTLGGVRGAGSIGATLLWPVDKATDMVMGDRGPNVSGLVTGQQPISRNAERRQSMTDALQGLGADPNSLAFKTGKLGGEVAGTAGAGGMLAQGARGLGAAPEVVNALRTGGFATGPSRLTPLGNLAVRSGAGAVAGGAQVGLVDPEHADIGAAIGGALPGASKLLGMAGSGAADLAQSGARRLMESALKPTLKQKQTGDAAIAVDELLNRGINPTKAGVEKIKSLIGDLNDRVSNALSGSSAVIDPQKVVNALSSAKQKFGNQVAPTADLNAIQGVESDFLNNGGAGDIPVQLAQKLKQGTYSTLKGKYGQLGSAETEAQKGLARGLKDEISAAVPEVGPLNAEESRLLSTLSVAERRAMMDVNKNPLGLAALAVHEPSAFIAFMADKSAAFKSMAARALNTASQGVSPGLNALAGPAVYRSLPRAGQRN